MSTIALLHEDIAPFADLGTVVELNGNTFIIVRDGVSIRIEPINDAYNEGYYVTRMDHTELKPSAAAVLSSSMFADVSRIARNQAIVLAPMSIKGPPVPVEGQFREVVGHSASFMMQVEPWLSLDLWLSGQARTRVLDGTDILLIDGPAGVGKTTLVRETALRRSKQYDGSLPIIIQISSRGRVLQNISDLIAFSLQDIRSNLTIEQLMSLIRHGIVILAIDGFDELSDPNGFETAWSGLNNLVSNVRGSATFLLAGRETFVSTEIMRRQLKSFDDGRDRLSALSIGDPSPTAARQWLLGQVGWSQELLNREFVEPIFVEGSYALRPFFLDVIAREPIALTSDIPPASDLLSYLVEVMTQREGQKFIEVLDPPDGNESAGMYRDYVGRFLEEVARDLAENQADSIADDALDLLATVAADGLLPDDQVAAVVRRARTVVFLGNDLRPGHIRFAHEQLLQHFLAREALRSVGDGEIPRYIRRNLFSRESLEVFAHVARGREDAAGRFLVAARANLPKPFRDRTNANLAVIGVAVACAVVPDNADLKIEGVGINEMHFPFAAPSGISIRDTTISILHAASADIRNVVFDGGVNIVTLEIDRQTLLSATLPLPQILVHPGGTTSDTREIQSLLSAVNEQPSAEGLAWTEGLAELLGRIDRYKTFWLRTNLQDTDRQGRRIVTHPDWPSVYKALKECDLVTVKSRQASGTRSEFAHFRQDVVLMEHLGLHKLLMPNF